MKVMRPPETADPGDFRRRPPRRRGRGGHGSGPLTRRELLLGGSALLVLAAIETVEHVRTGSGILGGHHAQHSRATVVYRSFHSRVLGHDVAYGIAWPPGVSPGSPLPVCFGLPGRGAGPGSVIGFLTGFLAEIVDGGARPFALASVDGGQSYWHRRASGEDRMAMLISEFVPLCERSYQLGGSRSRRAGAGWSMGGYGVLLADETYPDLFSSVVATSPAIWPTYQDMMNGPRDAFDSAADFAAHDVIGHAQRLAGTPLLVECGTADPFYPFVRDLCAVLPAGARYRFLPGGGHDFASWRKFQPAALRFTARHFGD
jgi:enterochelin esterase-like enzyme